MALGILNYRNMSLAMLAFLAACDGSYSPTATSSNATTPAASSTFAETTATPPVDPTSPVGGTQSSVTDTQTATTTTPTASAVDSDQTPGTNTQTAATATPPVATSFVWPKDNAVIDPNHYFEGQDSYSLKSAAYSAGPNGGAGDSSHDIQAAGLDLSAVDETPSSKHQQIVLNNQTIDYTARAGHLIAHAPVDPANPTAAPDAEASIFYMSYTRDDIPADQRPVTFLFNGGPGEPSIWLHLGSWAPKHLEVNAPNLPAGPDMPDSFPLVDNPQTLLDQTDLVFVDIVGSGFSEAIKPHKNGDFWNTESDAQVFRDFITAYINRNNRQSSPKYLFGESYSGIRTPIVADLLVKAGTKQYQTDPTGKTPVVLSGFVLNSPVLDYGSGGYIFPTLGLTADYYGMGTARGAMSETEYADYLRDFTTKQYRPVAKGSIAQSAQFNQTVNSITGIPVSTIEDDFFLLDGAFSYLLGYQLYPNTTKGSAFDTYDLRISKGEVPNYDISFYEDAGFYGAIKPYLADEFSYSNKDAKQLYGTDVADGYWNHNHNLDNLDFSVPDLVEAMALAPDLRALVLHGYHDTVCPFFQTEVDLQNGGALPQLVARLSVKDYDGGHMIYLTPSSHVAMGADLHNFYQPATTVASAAKPSVAAR